MEEFFTDEEVQGYLDSLLDDEELVSENEVPGDFFSEGEFYAEGKIVQKGGKWFVTDEEGKKNLGGPYSSREEAVKRLQQIEHFKNTSSKADFEELVKSGDTYHNRLSPDSPHNKNHRKIPKKCRKCGSTKNIDLHHPSGDRKNLSSTKGIIPLCRKCHRKLHQGKKGGSKADFDVIERILAAGDSGSVFDLGVIEGVTEDIKRAPDMDVLAVACEILDPQNIKNSFVDSFLAQAKLDKQEDLLYVAFKLVHEGTNGNKDTFLEKELIQAQKSPILKGVNWGHTNENIGVIYDSQFVEATKDEPAHIVAAAAIWKYKFPEKAAEILQRFAEGRLFFSMETWFEKAKCSDCGNEYKIKEDVCTHLATRFSALSRTTRILNKLTFGGVGIVDDPADKLAEGLALAKIADKENKATSVANTDKEGVKIQMDEKTLEILHADLDEARKLAKDYEQKVDEAMADKTTSEEKLQEAQAEVENLKKELEKAQANIEAKQAELDEALAKIEEAKKDAEELETLRAKVAEAQANEMAETRVAALAELGYGPSRDDEAFADHFNRIKGLGEDAYTALIETLKASASKEEEEEGAEPVKASRIPSGDPNTGEGRIDFEALKKVMSAASDI